jgi:hypothetical protein
VEQVEANLVAGVNTIRLQAVAATGPNVDQLEVLVPTTPFEPTFAQIGDLGRIELEATNGTARTTGVQSAEFYFKVAADGLYALDLAANAGAPAAGGLTYFLNGAQIDRGAFPEGGEGAEERIYVQLQAGVEYRLRTVSDIPGANALDYLDVQRMPSNPNADIVVQSLDPAYFDDRLHFSYIEDPDAVDPAAPDRDYKDSGTVRITNTGTQALTLTDYQLDGPFVLANPAQLAGLSIAAGQSVDVTVLFNRAAYTPPTSNVDGTSTVFTGKLKLITNDADSPFVTVDLAGFWQARDEGGQEPNVNEIWRIFGFGNVIEGLRLTGGGENSVLSTNDVFAKTDETEVLSPYWRLADGVTQAKITQIAAFHGPGGADVGIHNPNAKGTQVSFWNHEGTDNQRLLPNAGNDTTFATRSSPAPTFPTAGRATTSSAFALPAVDGSAPQPYGRRDRARRPAGSHREDVPALDANGVVIPNVYLGIMDYTGINYDYNDNLFVIEGVVPVGFGQSLAVSGLDDAAADDRLVFSRIENPANANQEFRDEATFTITNDGFEPLVISSLQVGNPGAFQIVGPTANLTVAAGASINVTVRFTGADGVNDDKAVSHEGTLTIVSNDVAYPTRLIKLAGLARSNRRAARSPWSSRSSTPSDTRRTWPSPS